jgi:transcriptional regulator with XRE-family HTH domain
MTSEEQSRSPGQASRRLGLLVRELRDQRGWSQAELAYEMSALVTPWYQSTVNRIETGGRTVTWDEAVALSTVLGIDLAEAANEVAGLDRVLAEYRRRQAEMEVVWARAVEQMEELVKEYGVVPSQRDLDQLREGTITPADLKERIAKRRKT